MGIQAAKAFSPSSRPTITLSHKGVELLRNGGQNQRQGKPQKKLSRAAPGHIKVHGFSLFSALHYIPKTTGCKLLKYATARSEPGAGFPHGGR